VQQGFGSLATIAAFSISSSLVTIVQVITCICLSLTATHHKAMRNKHFLRGMATVNYWADDVKAAREWYAELLGVQAYFQQPNAENPAYFEFRIGDDEDEFGIIDRKYAPKVMQPGPGGAILLWHVDDIGEAFKRLIAMGAKEYDPITKRGETGFVTASVIDPFGNVIGIMYNPHYVERHNLKEA
jgi:predicted enzyme related to lactoylglutathione lyase